MGSNTSSISNSPSPAINQMQLNDIFTRTSNNLPKSEPHSGWKILRINLISTFKDFRNERREVLKMIEEELQPIAKKSKIILVLEDFSAGNSAAVDDPEVVYLYAHSLRQSRKETGAPIYIHFFGECSGFTIDHSFTDVEFLFRNNLRQGMSLPECAAAMAYAKNPYALFLHRNPSFLSELPFNAVNFKDDPEGRTKAEAFAGIVKAKMGEQYYEYSCKTAGFDDPHHKRIVLVGLNKMIRVVQDHLETIIEDFPLATGKSSSKSLPKDLEQYIASVRSKASNNGVVLLKGDYGSGKSTILRYLKSEIPHSAYVSCEDGKNFNQLQDEILAQLGHTRGSHYDAVLSSSRQNFTILMDDADQIGKDLSKLLPPNSPGSLIATVRRTKIKSAEVIQIASNDMEDAAKHISRHYEENFESKVAPESIAKATRILVAAKNSADDGDSPTFSRTKCGIIGSLMRSGLSPDKLAKLAALDDTSVCEAELLRFEYEVRGHLLLATLGFLALVPSGLNECQLRYLLAPEDGLLPFGFRRKPTGIAFDHRLESFKRDGYVMPIRWRYVIRKIEHYLINLDEDVNLYQLTSICGKLIKKKYLSKPDIVFSLQKRLETLRTAKEPWIVIKI